MTEISPDNRMQAYLQKIAAGPKLSKDLTEEEAEESAEAAEETKNKEEN